MILGVRKINSSSVLSRSDRLLNSQPSSGMRCNSGTRLSDLLRSLSKIPPMTVVSPFATCTVVLARCVTIGGMPWISRPKSAKSFWILIYMVTVSAAVICGVTRRLRAAS